jgi:hypothetical protein
MATTTETSKAPGKDKKKKKVPQEREDLLNAAKTLLKHWLHIRDFLLLAFQNDAITREQEQAFLELKSETARTQRGVSGKIPEDLQFGADKITDFLRQAISVAHLRSLPLADKRGLVSGWHVASVMLHRAVGALEFMIEVNESAIALSKKKRKAPRGIRDIKTESAGPRQNNIVSITIGLIVLAAYVAGVGFVLFGLF